MIIPLKTDNGRLEYLQPVNSLPLIETPHFLFQLFIKKMSLNLLSGRKPVL